MKFFIVFFIQMVLFVHLVNAQQSTLEVPKSNLEKYNYFMKKRNTNNTIGWVCLGTGIGMGFIGFFQFVGANITPNTNSDKKGTLFLAGNVVALVSIPFFITAHNNKQKASLALKGESVTFNNRMHNTSYTALAIIIKL
jgi:hypothetical protein